MEDHPFRIIYETNSSEGLFGSVSTLMIVLLETSGQGGFRFGIPADPSRSTRHFPQPASILINTTLIALFAVQHMVMARPWFKDRVTRIIPKPMERSLFVLSAGLLLFLLCALWQPIPKTVWKFEFLPTALVLRTGFLFGCSLVVYSKFLINPWDLFGLRQVYLYLKDESHTAVPFVVHSLYRYVKHPMMLGFLILL